MKILAFRHGHIKGEVPNNTFYVKHQKDHYCLGHKDDRGDTHEINISEALYDTIAQGIDLQNKISGK